MAIIIFIYLFDFDDFDFVLRFVLVAFALELFDFNVGNL